MQTAEQERALGINDLSEFLGVPKPTIYQLIKTRQIPLGSKVGRRRVWLQSDVVAWLRRREGKA